MDCLFYLCLSIASSLGFQSGVYTYQGPADVYDVSRSANKYGTLIADVSFKMKTDYLVIEPFYHLSGVNAEEWDWGMNSSFIGTHYTNKSLEVSYSVGVQAKTASWRSSNNYGRFLSKFRISYDYKDKITLSYSNIDGMGLVSVGIKVDGI